MRIEYLHFFLDVAETLSISKTARRYYISPQGLSRAIQALEKELNVSLFDRFGNNLSLSKAGQALVSSARETVQGYERLMHEAHNQAFPDMPEGKTEITLCATTFALNKVFTLFNESLALKFPFVRIRILECTHEQILKAAFTPRNNYLYVVNMPSYDMGEILSRNDISFQPLMNLEVFVMAEKSSPYARRKIYTRKDLAEVPIAYYNERLLEEIIFALLGDHTPHNIVLKTTNLQLLMQALSEGRCVTVTDDLAAMSAPGNHFVYLPIDETVLLQVGAFYTRKEDVLPEIPEIVHFVKSYLERLIDRKKTLCPNHHSSAGLGTDDWV